MENQVNTAKASMRNLYLALLAMGCLVVSLTVFYPLSMKVADYNYTLLSIWAYSFYILQITSFVLTVLSFINGISLLQVKKDIRNYLVLLIDTVVFIVFVYEVYWFINHL